MGRSWVCTVSLPPWSRCTSKLQLVCCVGCTYSVSLDVGKIVNKFKNTAQTAGCIFSLTYFTTGSGDAVASIYLFNFLGCSFVLYSFSSCSCVIRMNKLPIHILSLGKTKHLWIDAYI